VPSSIDVEQGSTTGVLAGHPGHHRAEFLRTFVFYTRAKNGYYVAPAKNVGMPPSQCRPNRALALRRSVRTDSRRTSLCAVGDRQPY
jgi:hypothetical protein